MAGMLNGLAEVLPVKVKIALALPALTVAEVTVAPIWVDPSKTAKLTVPSLTGPAPLVTVADSVTGWSLVPKEVEALAATVVVPAGLTVRLWLVSLLVRYSG